MICLSGDLISDYTLNCGNWILIQSLNRIVDSFQIMRVCIYFGYCYICIYKEIYIVITS